VRVVEGPLERPDGALPRVAVNPFPERPARRHVVAVPSQHNELEAPPSRGARDPIDVKRRLTVQLLLRRGVHVLVQELLEPLDGGTAVVVELAVNRRAHDLLKAGDGRGPQVAVTDKLALTIRLVPSTGVGARLRHGGVRPNDNARMWAFLPKYILASLLFSGFALLFGGLLWALVISGGGYVLGLLNRSTPMLFSTMSTGHRMGLLGGLATALYLLVIWFVPWGAPNRRGAAHTIEVVTRSDSARLVLVVVILAAALGFQILFLLDALPWQTFEPIISAMP